MVFLLLSFFGFAETIDRIAAIVNDDVITISDLYAVGSEYIAAAQPNVRKAELEVLDSLIMNKLIEQEIVRLGHDVTDEEFQGALSEIAQTNGLRVDQLRTEVERSGLKWEDYEMEIRQSLRQMKFNQLVLQPRITIDEAALLDNYRRLKNEQPDVIDLSAIVVKNLLPLRTAEEVSVSMEISLEEAEALLLETKQQQEKEQQDKIMTIQKELQAGTDFAQVARTYDETGLGSTGGKMGSFAEGQLRGELNDVAFLLTAGQSSQAIYTDSGIFFLYVSNRYKQELPPFEQVRPKLVESYYAERFEVEMESWYETTKRRAAIDVKLVEAQ
jgi:peptidyl-prolyl cis-trans isomerase SurA